MKYSEWQIEVAKTNRAKISWKFGRQIAWTLLHSASVFCTDESTKFYRVCQKKKAKWSEGAHAEVTEKVCILEHRRPFCLLKSIWLEKFPGSSLCWMEKTCVLVVIILTARISSYWKTLQLKQVVVKTKSAFAWHVISLSSKYKFVLDLESFLLVLQN